MFWGTVGGQVFVVRKGAPAYFRMRSRSWDDNIYGQFGVWRSPVAHLLWEQGVGGSNPLTPTNLSFTSETLPQLARRVRTFFGRCGSGLGFARRHGRRSLPSPSTTKDGFYEE
jgi:hypothetical protein